jgi:hypothetical protein
MQYFTYRKGTVNSSDKRDATSDEWTQRIGWTCTDLLNLVAYC